MQSRLILWTSDCWASGLSSRLYLSRRIPFLPCHQTAVSWRQVQYDKIDMEMRCFSCEMMKAQWSCSDSTWCRSKLLKITLLLCPCSCLFPYYCPANSSAMKSCEGGFVPVNTSGLRGSKSSCCSECEGGTYRPYLSLTLQCLPCPAGYFCPPGTLHSTSSYSITIANVKKYFWLYF